MNKKLINCWRKLPQKVYAFIYNVEMLKWEFRLKYFDY